METQLLNQILTEVLGARQEIKGLNQKIDTEIQKLRQEVNNGLQGLRQEMNDGLQELKQEMNGEMQGLRQEMNGEIQGLKQEVNGEIQGLKQQLNRIEERQIIMEQTLKEVKELAEHNKETCEVIMRVCERKFMKYDRRLGFLG